MRYENFDIRINTAGDGRLRVMASGPRGIGEVSAEVEPLLFGERRGRASAVLEAASARSRDLVADPAGAPAGMSRRAGSRRLNAPMAVGQALQRTLLPRAVKALWDESRGAVRETNLGCRLRLFLNPQDQHLGWLAAQPWELLCDEAVVGGARFLALERGISVVRYLEVPRSVPPAKAQGKIEILALASAPRDAPPLDLKEERKRLERAWTSSGLPSEVRFVEQATATALQSELSLRRCTVLHFLGHAQFDASSGTGVLVLESKDGSPALVSGQALGPWLSGPEGPRLVVLNACATGAGLEGARAFGGVAASLISSGVPSVVAMQVPVTDGAAIAFAGALHRKLAANGEIDEAVTEGRLAMHSLDPYGVEWAVPVLFSREPGSQSGGQIEGVSSDEVTKIRIKKGTAGRDIWVREPRKPTDIGIDELESGRDLDILGRAVPSDD